MTIYATRFIQNIILLFLHKNNGIISIKKQDSWIDRLLMNKTFYIITTLTFILVFGLIFKWQHKIHIFDDNYVVDGNLLGTYGDFIGGVLGTIFALISVLFLIRTFTQQKAVTVKNEEQIENQRFNDLFFELLRLISPRYLNYVGQFKKRGETKLLSLIITTKIFMIIRRNCSKEHLTQQPHMREIYKKL